MKQSLLFAYLAILSTFAFSQTSSCLTPTGPMRLPGDTAAVCYPGHTGPSMGSLTQFYTFTATYPHMDVNLTPILGTTCSFPNTMIYYSGMRLYDSLDCMTPIAYGASFTWLTVGHTYVWEVTMTPADPMCVWIAESCPEVIENTVYDAESIELEVHEKNGNPELAWQVPGGTSFIHYEVLRSTNKEIGYKTAGDVPGSPNSESDQVYHFTDTKSVSDNWYRIRATDLDGNKSFSNSVSFQSENDNPTFSLSPNPGNGLVHITCRNCPQAATKLQIEVTDLTGKLISKQTASVSSGYQLDLSHMEKGIYFVQLKTSYTSQSIRYLKQ